MAAAITTITKRDGSTEAFNDEKIFRSIQKAVIDAGKDPDDEKGLVREVARDVIADVKGGPIMENDGASTDEIRANILERLDQESSAVSYAWLEFEKRYKGGTR